MWADNPEEFDEGKRPTTSAAWSTTTSKQSAEEDGAIFQNRLASTSLHAQVSFF
jgi:hypothetical protein